MRIVLRLIIILGSVLAAAVGVLWLGSAASLDRDFSHTVATRALPWFAPAHSGLVRIAAGDFEFRARIAGFDNPAPAGDIMLLHGFPETSIMWVPLIEAASAAGYRVVAIDQRGYSPGARPDAIDAYRLEHLVEDVLGVASAVGFTTFHLVAHDWGAGVGWSLAATHPERLRSFASLSIPHIAAFGAAIANDPDQRRKSSYMLLFRTPWLPETLLTFNRLHLLEQGLYAEHGDVSRAEYRTVFSEPGALGAALNWYRAADPGEVGLAGEVAVPVLLVWGNRDPAVGRAAVDNQRPYLAGPYSEVELDAGHWLMETHAPTVNAAVMRHIGGI